MVNGEVIEDYLETEVTKGALLGPFTSKPFTPFMVNAMMTRPKNAQVRETRHVIIDMSFLNQHSINFGIPKET